jgi:hypothetical protein
MAVEEELNSWSARFETFVKGGTWPSEPIGAVACAKIDHAFAPFGRDRAGVWITSQSATAFREAPIRNRPRIAGGATLRQADLEAIRRALEDAGVTFVEANGGGPGVRLKR